MQVKDKQTMYRMLSSGAFGNTLPMFFSVESWQASPVAKQYESWGLRAMRPGDKQLKLYVPSADVPQLAREFTYGVNISPMVDMYKVFRGEVIELDSGLYLWGTFSMQGQWREALGQLSKGYTLTNAKRIMRIVLNENSYDDIMALLDLYPQHTVEFTALDRCLGLCQGRNAVIWEVRDY